MVFLTCLIRFRKSDQIKAPATPRPMATRKEAIRLPATSRTWNWPSW